MELTPLLILLLPCFLFVVNHLLKPLRSPSNLPPGPRPVPVFGNLLQIRKYGRLPHQAFAKISEKYGPLSYLKLGSIDMILVSSAELSKEILHRHDHSVSMRPPIAVTKALKLKTLALAWNPPEEVWRDHRKIMKEELVSNSQLDAGSTTRQKKAEMLRKYVRGCSFRGESVDVRDLAFVTMINVLWQALFSMDCAGYGDGSSRELREIVHGVLKCWGKPNVGDYFPILKGFDLQGIVRETEGHIEKLFAIFDGITDERLRSGHHFHSDVLESLLEKKQLGRDEMNYLFMDLVLGITDTTSSIITWAMTELVRNPGKLTKAKEELKAAITTNDNEAIKESEISELKYLQAIIKETIRLHNPGPLLPRYNHESDFEVNGCKIPKNAIIVVNAWAISRDPRIWSDPYSFEPERFVELDIEIAGQDFRFIPFGTGRRICPGMPLAQRMLQLTIASLIHGFDWKLEEGVGPEELDMSESYGMTLEKTEPLKLYPVKV